MTAVSPIFKVTEDEYVATVRRIREYDYGDRSPWSEGTEAHVRWCYRDGWPAYKTAEDLEIPF